MHAYHKLIDRFAQTRPGGWAILNIFNPIDARLMRLTNGKLSSFMGTDFYRNSVLLRCAGAKSGKLRDIPLLTTPFGSQFVLIASAAGQKKNPAWYYNLKANPECSLLFPGQDEIPCLAHEAVGEERDQAWAAANAQYSGYKAYQGRTERQIPVMILTPVSQE